MEETPCGGLSCSCLVVLVDSTVYLAFTVENDCHDCQGDGGDSEGGDTDDEVDIHLCLSHSFRWCFSLTRPY